ncbi:ATP-binding cassette domain-containing protein [Candidatus Saccharibacteria bacterium]|nr:ATP-binding cassette domain-containing protein [Candidatus Saccharibacteria bacterium]
MLHISNLTFSHANKTLFDSLNLNLPSSEKIAIIGDNGAGKTTLLRLIAGELTPDDGYARAIGEVGYLKQTHEDLADKSGGERTKMKLEALFDERPNVLLLDEPTNNLDQEARAWLHNELQHFDGLVLLVSHDRNFINQVADKVLEIKDGKAELYNGNYSDYLTRTEQIKNEQSFAYEKANRERQKLLKQISVAKNQANKVGNRSFDKVRDESKTKFRAGKSSSESHAGKIIKAISSKLERLNDIQKPLERKTYSAQVSSNFTHDRQLLKVENLAKSYGDKCLFSNLDFEVRTGERVRVIGGNGTGKSTLFKIVLGEVEADSGTIKLTPNLKLGYISQDVFGLNLDESFIDQIDIADRSEIFRAASTMDFEPSDMSILVGKLSRGQITKLAVLKIILAPIDLLILDELTNHLDIRARANIENALSEYKGAVLVATHDEVFVNTLNIDRNLNLSIDAERASR